MAHLTVAKFELSWRIFESNYCSPTPTSLIETKVRNYKTAAQGFSATVRPQQGYLWLIELLQNLH